MKTLSTFKVFDTPVSRFSPFEYSVQILILIFKSPIPSPTPPPPQKPSFPLSIHRGLEVVQTFGASAWRTF